MSATTFKNLLNTREHKERAQPSARAHLGLLEKHKDYKKRADDYHSKEKRITALRRRAAMRNPDEFHHGMIKSQVKDGVHSALTMDRPKFDADELKLLKTQDKAYITSLAVSESRKVDRMKASLHMLGAATHGKASAGSGSGPKHTIFVDTPEDVAAFDAAAHFDTDAALVGRAFNRPTRDTLASAAMGGAGAPEADNKARKRSRKEMEAAYAELNSRQERAAKLSRLSHQITMEQELMKKGRRVKVADATASTGAVFKWKAQRKK